jgi:hypothetical protein
MVDEVAEMAPVRGRAALADANALEEADRLAGAGAGGFAEGGDWREVDRTTAEQVLGTAIVAVDDLPIVDISVPSSGRAQVRIRQTLPSGRLLDLLLESGATAEASRVAAAAGQPSAIDDQRTSPTGTISSVTLSVDRLLVRGSAAVGRDSLTTLLGRLREPPRLD